MLFLLGEGSLVFIQHTFWLALCILNSVIDADIFEVERIFQNLVGIGTVRSVGFRRHNIAMTQCGFTLHTPFCRIRRESYADITAQIVRNLKDLLHEFLDDFRGNPRCTQTHINFGCFQLLGLCFSECVNIDSKFRVRFSGELCDAEFCADIAGKILVCHLPASFRVSGVCTGVFEDHAGKFRGDTVVLAGSAEQFCHIGQVYSAMLAHRYRQCFAGSVHAGDNSFWANRPLREHICLAFELLVFIEVFQRAEQIIRGILLKQPRIATIV